MRTIYTGDVQVCRFRCGQGGKEAQSVGLTSAFAHGWLVCVCHEQYLTSPSGSFPILSGGVLGPAGCNQTIR